MRVRVRVRVSACGQFIAASSNMCVYCEPCPEKSAATLPRVSTPAAR